MKKQDPTTQPEENNSNTTGQRHWLWLLLFPALVLFLLLPHGEGIPLIKKTEQREQTKQEQDKKDKKREKEKKKKEKEKKKQKEEKKKQKKEEKAQKQQSKEKRQDKKKK